MYISYQMCRGGSVHFSWSLRATIVQFLPQTGTLHPWLLDYPVLILWCADELPEQRFRPWMRLINESVYLDVLTT